MRYYRYHLKLCRYMQKSFKSVKIICLVLVYCNNILCSLFIPCHAWKFIRAAASTINFGLLLLNYYNFVETKTYPLKSIYRFLQIFNNRCELRSCMYRERQVNFPSGLYSECKCAIVIRTGEVLQRQSRNYYFNYYCVRIDINYYFYTSCNVLILSFPFGCTIFTLFTKPISIKRRFFLFFTLITCSLF